MADEIGDFMWCNVCDLWLAVIEVSTPDGHWAMCKECYDAWLVSLLTKGEQVQ